MVVLTFWLMALAPAVSQALAASGGSGWSQICSSSSGAPQDSDAALSMLGHCTLCSAHAQDLAPPPAAEIETPSVELRQQMPERFLSAGQTLHAWRHGQARAPPR